MITESQQDQTLKQSWKERSSFFQRNVKCGSAEGNAALEFKSTECILWHIGNIIREGFPCLFRVKESNCAISTACAKRTGWGISLIYSLNECLFFSFIYSYFIRVNAWLGILRGTFRTSNPLQSCTSNDALFQCLLVPILDNRSCIRISMESINVVVMGSSCHCFTCPSLILPSLVQHSLYLL